jgi:hypothetical protein
LNAGGGCERRRRTEKICVKQIPGITAQVILARLEAAGATLLAWNAIPYETNDGVQMVRESIVDLAAVAANNIIVFAPQTADSNPLNSSYDPTTGLFSGGDPEHRDEPDLLRYGRIGVHAAGQAAIAMGLSDAIPSAQLPEVGLPLKGGPQIAHVYEPPIRV